jgi:hypothetical protein
MTKPLGRGLLTVAASRTRKRTVKALSETTQDGLRLRIMLAGFARL